MISSKNVVQWTVTNQKMAFFFNLSEVESNSILAFFPPLAPVGFFPALSTNWCHVFPALGTRYKLLL